MSDLKNLLLVLTAALLLQPAHGASPRAERLRVVATIPDLADIARELGGERVDVTSIAEGTMNVHAVPLKPSALIAVNRADLFVQMGLSLEHTYVPGMLMKARNARIQPGQPGFVNCSVGWEPLDVPESLDRSQGVDLHPLGNPHYNLDPRGGAHIAARILDGLVAVDPAGESTYRARYEAYAKRLEEARRRWDEVGRSLRGSKVVTYHRDVTYLLRYHGIESVGTIESKPGVPPTPRYLAQLVARMRAEGVRVVLTAAWSNNDNARFVASKTEGTVVELPLLVGGAPGADSWIAMMDLVHARLAKALGGA